MPESLGVRRKSEPMFNVPGVVLGVFAVMFAIHALRIWILGEEALLWEFAFIPGRFALLFGADPLQALTDRLATGPETAELVQRVALARAIVMEGDAKPWSVLTYALLHGSWTHLLLNSIWLLAFGSAVARRFGSVRFVAFMALTAIGGALGHLLTHTEDVVPMIGASAAVSGCMAAALRFAFQAGAPLGGFSIGGIEAYRLPALGLRDILRERRAMMFLMVWLVMNILTGIGAPEFGLADAAIAWEAHIGGFVVGLFAFQLFDPSPSPPLPSGDDFDRLA